MFDFAFQKLHVLRPGFALVFVGQSEHLVGHVQAIRFAGWPDSLADSKTSIPPPEPRSSTTSPGFNLANAAGLPQPSKASRASSGICLAWAASYRSEVIGSAPLKVLLAVAP
jgi:hypothetical protein